jgi:hypothetical protein
VNNKYSDFPKIINIAQSSLALNEGSAFKKQTISPDDEINTTYEVIEVKDETNEFKFPLFHIVLKYK